ncbi:MAG: DUF4345 domain-containing protein [Actinomycetota bacterium]
MPRRRFYQGVLAVLSVIPLLAITQVFALGTGRELDDAVIDPGLDHQFRYLGGVYLAILLLIWWSIPNIERARSALGVACAAVFLGGVGRGVAILDVGAEPTISVVFFVLEVAIVPALLLSYRRDVDRATATPDRRPA